MTHQSGQFCVCNKDVRYNEATLYSYTSINISFSINQNMLAYKGYKLIFINIRHLYEYHFLVLNENLNRSWNHRKKGNYIGMSAMFLPVHVFMINCLINQWLFYRMRCWPYMCSLSSSQQSWLSLLPQHPVLQ